MYLIGIDIIFLRFKIALDDDELTFLTFNNI